MPVVFVKPEKKYLRSYWETFGEICHEKVYMALREPFPYDETVNFYTRIINACMPALFAVDTNTDRCIGWCDAVSDNGIDARLGMGLLKSMRNKGIGTELLKNTVELSIDYGYKSLKLDVWKSNKRAVHIYEKAGFTIYGEDDKKLCMVLELNR